MVKALNEEELDKYISKYLDHKDCSKLCLSLSLSNKNIQKWTKEGKFAHLKKEIQIYQNVEFGCLKEDDRCHYIFFVESLNSHIRICNLIDNLISNLKTSLIKCSPYKRYPKYPDKSNSPIGGQYNDCPLF